MKICLLPGDGIGVEIVDAAVRYLTLLPRNLALKSNMINSSSVAALLMLLAYPCRKQPLLLLRLLTQYCWVP